MPGLPQYLSEVKDADYDLENQPENAKLWLPSDLPGDRIDVVCAPGLRKVEAKLQHARCYDSLHGVRHTLRIKTRMMLFKNSNVRGQRQSGKSREVINRVVRRARWYNEEDEDEEEKERLRRFQEVCAREDDEREDEDEEQDNDTLDLIHPDRQELTHRSKFGTGETRKELSWIWLSGGKIDLEDGADENDNEVLRSEWCRSRARARRAKEEVLLVQEEMRRTLEYLEWRATEWELCAGLDFGRTSAEEEGATAYALMQADLQRALKQAFEAEWKKPLDAVDKAEVTEMESTAEEANGEISDEESEGEGEEEGDDEAPFEDAMDLELGSDGDESGVEQWDPEVDGF
ncbi:hypothetical protein VNI00_008898 [Paramarasmius palmivorus]|uniref:Uncharacterized protein n=1 Tax=Paramarasmius palmivorus TaxID=297713 RepID=A0AAW0CPG6_9AGAR